MSPQFEVRQETRAEVLILSPVGKLDSKTSNEFEQAVVKALAADQERFVVDLAKVEYLSSAGIRVLLMMAKRLKAGGGDVKLCRLRDETREVLDVAGLLSVFDVLDDLQEALAALSGHVPTAPADAVPSRPTSTPTSTPKSPEPAAPPAPPEPPTPPAPAPAKPTPAKPSVSKHAVSKPAVPKPAVPKPAEPTARRDASTEPPAKAAADEQRRHLIVAMLEVLRIGDPEPVARLPPDRRSGKAPPSPPTSGGAAVAQDPGWQKVVGEAGRKIDDVVKNVADSVGEQLKKLKKRD